MENHDDKRYVRLESTIFIEMLDGETQEQAEERFMDLLPEGMDIVSFRSQYWEPDE